MIIIDNHIHSKLSCDSNIEVIDLINKAIYLDYQGITITEHMDLLPFELAENGLFSLKHYETQINALRQKFPEFSIGIGLEIGDYQRVREQADSLTKEIGLDLVLGAVHFLSDNTNVAIPLPHPLSKHAALDYYKANLEIVTTCNIDVLAHLGVYKRYYTSSPDESHCLPVVREMFKVMIDRGIALEINYSAFRKNYKRLLPEPEYISIYRDLGGHLFSIGSDSHHIEHFHDNYHMLPDFLANAEITEKGILIIG